MTLQAPILNVDYGTDPREGGMLVAVINAVGGTASASTPLRAKIKPGRQKVVVDRGMYGTIYIAPMARNELEALARHRRAKVIEVDERGPAVVYYAEA